MVTVFCVRRPGEASPANVLGFDGAPVRLIEEGPLGVWICEGAAAPGIDTVQLHDAVVRSALRTATPLPARFGTVFADERELRESLRERRDELVAGLERVAGRVEMGVRVEWDEVAASAALTPVGGGREYLEARRRELEGREALRARADALLDEVEVRIVTEASERVRKLLPERGVAGVVAHLVHRHTVGGYRARFEQARSAFPQVNLRLTGPWAPYSFT